LLLIEIVSPDDRHQELLCKLEDYRAWAVPNIWVVEPLLNRFSIYNAGSLVEVKQFELPEFNVRIDAAELFAEATAQ
jgi:Uma2 family endonuclease